MITLGTLQSNRGIKTVTNLNPTSQAFIDICNDAVRELMDVPDGFYNTIVKMTLCGYGGFLVFPRIVGTVLALNNCNHAATVRNRWYEFQPLLSSEYCSDRNWQSEITYAFTGTVPVFNPIPAGTHNVLQIYRRDGRDNGRSITFFGIDSNGWPAQETVTLGLGPTGVGYVRTTTSWQIIQRVNKDVTWGYVDVYQFRATEGDLLELGHYMPGETDPEYLTAKITGGCKWPVIVDLATSCCCCQGQVTVLAKMTFVNMASPLDLCQIDDIEAIKTQIMAIRASEAGDMQKYGTMKAAAIKILNMRKENKEPLQQTSCSIEPFNGIALGRYQAW
jgi:hypothetical protein